MNTQLLIAYCTAIFVASIIPGPSSILALTQGARYGFSAGALSGIGNVIASVLQGTVALLVISQVGNISPATLGIIKYFGAAYVIYLGISLLKVKSFGSTVALSKSNDAASSYKHLWDGFAFAIFNPKALTFFAALFPQFVSSSPITGHVIAAIFVPIAVIAFVCFIFYVVAGNLLIGIMGKTEHIGKFFGTMIILAGTSLLLA
jgi:homoserine/homoserine lactone efflux protein